MQLKISAIKLVEPLTPSTAMQRIYEASKDLKIIHVPGMGYMVEGKMPWKIFEGDPPIGVLFFHYSQVHAAVLENGHEFFGPESGERVDKPVEVKARTQRKSTRTTRKGKK